jgi:hypothetical protein
VADVNLVADAGLSVGEEFFDGPMARDLHQSDHGRCREGAGSTDMAGDQIAVDHPLRAALEAWPDTFNGVHDVDCRQ